MTGMVLAGAGADSCIADRHHRGTYDAHVSSEVRQPPRRGMDLSYFCGTPTLTPRTFAGARLVMNLRSDVPRSTLVGPPFLYTPV